MTGKTGTSTNCAVLIRAFAVILLLNAAVPAAAQSNIYDLGYNVTTQDIQADNTNTVHIAWADRGILYYGKIVNNAITGKVQVATGLNTIFWRPYISAEPDGGSVHIAWTTGGMGNALKHSWKAGGGWQTETVLEAPSNQWLTQATCAIDSSGILHVMFCIWNNVNTDEWSTIFYMRKPASGNWEDAQRFAPLTPEHKHPMLFVDSSGRVHATWDISGRLGSDSYDAYYCTAASGGKLAYANTVKLPKRADCNANGYGDLYVDHGGVVHRSIGGWSNAVQKMCIDHTKKPAGGSFQTPTRASIGFLNLKEGDPVPAVVASENGQVIVAWGQIGSDGSNTVKASFYDPDKRAWSLSTIDPAAGIPLAPNSYRVALTRTDTEMFCVWRGGNGHLKLMVMPLDGTPPDEPPPPPPGEDNPVAVVTATPISGPSPLAVTFDGSGSYDPDGNIISYSWDFGDGSTGTGVIVTHTYLTGGNFTARLTVADNDGNIDSDSEVIQAGEPSDPPVADFIFTPSTGIYPCEIVFDGGRSHDPDGKIVQYTWNFGDGSRGSGQVVRYTYTRWGTFSVSLTVRDDAGAMANKIRSLEIRRLYQPLNIRWETHMDESLFQTRHVNNVSWERNPANDSLGVQIVLHRIWRKGTGESELIYRLIGEVTADVFSYVDKDTDADSAYVYTVTVRDSQGRESPIVGGAGNSSLNPSSKDSQSLFKKGRRGEI
jgi:PKD repeat protein